jgi:hypothetical protein
MLSGINWVGAALEAVSCSNHGLEAWQLRRIPSTADGFDEKDAGIHASPLNVDVITLICQQDGLRRDDLQIVVYPAHIPIREELQ